MVRFHLKYFVLFLIALCSSCANYKINVIPDLTSPEEIAAIENEEVEYSVYLVGDAGNSPMGGTAAGLMALEKHLKTAPKNSKVIFLGDNIYPKGLPSKRQDTRALAEHRLQAQLDILDDFKGDALFIPGNHDWAQYGLKGVRRQERFVEKHLNKGIEDEEEWKNYFHPDKGCGGPELIEVNDNLAIVVMDSQWYLGDWDKEPEINNGCEAKSRKVFSFLLEEMLRKNRNKNVIVAMHHPLYSNGTHGGYFTSKEHLFPLRDLNPDLYIPLPGLGSAAAFLRGVIGTKQDISHPDYRTMKKDVLAAAKKNGRFIFVSGHEHNLQYFENDNQYFIVSGGGSKNGPARLGNGAQFAYGHQGFARLDFYKDGSTWVEFYAAEYDGSSRSVFRKKIKGELPKLAREEQTSFPEYEEHKDSVTTHVLNTPVKKNGFFGNVFFGKHYRELYREKFTFPVLELDKFEGGVVPVKRGGGNQTNSLRLETEDGHQYVMRSMTKDASRTIPYPFNKLSFSSFVVEDNFLSTHPFASSAVPYLASKAGVYHTNPEFYYIPKQPALAEHNDLFGGEVYLVEERPAKDWSEVASLGNSSKIIGTPDLSEKIVKNHKHRVDQRWVAKSRIFDMLIGDWDRHDDQWRWASYEDENDIKTYRPIPRDRDQPFSKYDGFVTGVARLTVPFMKQLVPFGPEVKNSKWANYNARQFDKSFLNQLEWSVWKEEAEKVQAAMTDEVIEQAFERWPEKAQEMTAGEIIKFVKARRDKLVEIARKHYLLLAKEVDVYGTDKRDRFEVIRGDEKTIVRFLDPPGKKKKDKEPELIYERTFLNKETKAINIYGLNGDDEFVLSGEARKGIKIRLLGGLDEDEFKDESKVSGWSKKTKVYDSKEGNKLELGTEGKDLTTDRREYNLYDRKEWHYEYDFLMPFPLLGFNPDDGFLIGANLLFTNYTFKKSPYGQTHNIIGTFAFATKGLDLTYTGEFLEAFNKWDFLINAQFQGTRFTNNFFGLGNETVDDVDDIDFNRVRNSIYRVAPAFKKRFAGQEGFLTIGPLVERVEVQNSPDRFISQIAGTELPTDIFDPRHYAGAELGLSYDNVNNNSMATRGIRFYGGLDFRVDLEDTDFRQSSLSADLTIYQSLTAKDNIVFATRFGTMHNFSDDFEFFQAAILGGNSNLRGFDAQRFAGRTSFFHNNDLRIRLGETNRGVIPFSFGITGGFDYGRVWISGENSGKWHTGYGGGIWIAPINFIVLSTELFKSEEDTRFTFRLGYAF